jgi:hypothetical protein
MAKTRGCEDSAAKPLQSALLPSNGSHPRSCRHRRLLSALEIVAQHLDKVPILVAGLSKKRLQIPFRWPPNIRCVVFCLVRKFSLWNLGFTLAFVYGIQEELWLWWSMLHLCEKRSSLSQSVWQLRASQACSLRVAFLREGWCGRNELDFAAGGLIRDGDRCCDGASAVPWHSLCAGFVI